MISMVFWNVYGLQPVTSMVMAPEVISSVPEKMRERRSASVRGRLQDALPQGSGAWKVLWRFLIAMLRHRATSSFERGASCFRHDLRMMEEETSRSLFLCNGGSCLHVAFDPDSVPLLWKSRHVMSRCSQSFCRYERLLRVWCNNNSNPAGCLCGMDMLIIPSCMSMIALDPQAGSNSPQVNWCEWTRIEVAE